jgi:hypothetical protein
MIKFTKKKTKNCILLAILTFGLLIGGFSYLFATSEIQDKEKSLNFTNFNTPSSTPQTSQISSFSNNGTSINCSVQQSIYNTSIISFTNLTDPDNNTFSASSPTIEGYNSEFTNITIEDIYAPNITNIIEDQHDDSSSFNYVRLVGSFTIPGKTYLSNFSTNLYRNGNGDLSNIRVRIYNSTWTEEGNIPDDYTEIISLGNIQFEDHDGWYNNYSQYFDPHLLNPEKTDNETFFIELYDSGDSAIYWRRSTDSVDDNGNMYAYYWDTAPPASWENITEDAPTRTVDLTLKVDLAPLDNNPNPEDINMTINNLPINGYENINGSGYWNTTDNIIEDLSGYINFTIRADWWNVSCNVSSVQINYTKTGLLANSSFNIGESGGDVVWNVTRSDFNFFDDRIKHTQTINFTLPSNWNSSTIEAYNGTGNLKTIQTTELTDEIRVKVLDASNGTEWYLLGNSTNLLDSIVAYKDGDNDPEYFSYSDIIKFNASFLSGISDGTANLTIHSPLPAPQYENYSEYITSFAGVNNSFPDWNISQDIEEYGLFLVQCYWNNDTDAGFLEKNITIIGETSLSLITPSNNSYYLPDASSENITVYYNDTGFEEPIDTVISYDNDTKNQGPLSNNGTSGYYSFELDPSTYSYGPHTITFSTTEQLYENKTTIFAFDIINETEIIDSGKSFTTVNYVNITYNFQYNDTIKGDLISGATIDNIEKLGDFNFSWYDKGGGNYTVNISANGIPARSDPYEINFTISSTGKRPQHITLSITVELRDTVIDSISHNETLKRYLGLNQTIEFYFNDSLNNDFITGLTTSDIEVYDNQSNLWETGDHNWTLHEIGNKYVLNVSTSGLNSGNYTILVNASQLPIYNFSMLTIDFYIEGNTSSISSINLEFANDPLENDTENGYYITNLGSKIDVFLNIEDENFGNNEITDTNASFIIRYNSTNSQGQIIIDEYIVGSYELEFDTDILNGTGIYDIQIIFTCPNYENATVSFTLKVEGSLSPTLPPLFPGGDIGFTFEDILPYMIIGIIGLIVVGAAVSVHRKVVVPKKERKKQALKEVKTIFDDAINLEHLLVLYKGMGACVFFKSFGSEKIDPDLISGFISAVSSFGKEIESQKALNEMAYGDKTLLLSDGEYIRVALVLDKKASLPLRRNLKEFVEAFEEKYGDQCEGWKGQLDVFKDAEPLVDEYFNTSIILPHRTNYKAADVKSLKNAHSKDILKVVDQLLKETEREFFFISKLLDKAKQETDKDIAEIFMGIKELREKELLLPIDISKLEEKPISASERKEIEQKVTQYLDLPKEQQQKIIEDLLNASPEERKAYLASLERQGEIVSAPVKSKVGGKVLKNEKEARKELKKLMKKADKQRGKEKFEKGIEIYEQAGRIANNWDMKKMFTEIQEEMRKTQIEQFEISMEERVDKAENFEKAKEYQNAAEEYSKAAKLASHIFKLGVHKMQKNVKEYTKKAKKYKRIS